MAKNLGISGSFDFIFTGIFLMLFLSADILIAKYFLVLELFNIYLIFSFLTKVTYLNLKGLNFFFNKFSDKFKNKFTKSYYHVLFTLLIQLIFIAFVLIFENNIFDSTSNYFNYFSIYYFIASFLLILNVLSKYYSPDFLKNLKTFFVPNKLPRKSYEAAFYNKNVAVVIPTYKPSLETLTLVRSIASWYPMINLIVVDDYSPKDETSDFVLNQIRELARNNYKIVLFRTQKNELKAGALNLAINYLKNLAYGKPDVVFTFDDDVKIIPSTIPEMIDELYKNPKIGIVCSQVRVINKNKNIITRLQAMEYHSFNITKIADNGFLKGPLVMQGMLAALKFKVIEDLGGFSIGHLIEDYDLTVRAKLMGWEVRISQSAVAWTYVPESLKTLWKQRARWTSGGLKVILENWHGVIAVFQDLIGHFTFLILFALIILSFVYAGSYHETAFTPVLFAISLINFSVIFVYSVLTHFSYPDRDFKDSILKFTFIAEFIYANFLSIILIGSYVYLLYTATAKKIIRTFEYLFEMSQSGFSKIGYSSTWGTR